MSSDGESDDVVVKMRGLPWSTTVAEIVDFFEGCTIQGGEEGVYLVMTKAGRPSGEAFVVMETPDDAEKALKKDREHVGTRYIEVFRCNKREMDWVVKKSGNLDNTLDDGCVRLRGLPFGSTREDIAKFFSGLEIVPNGIALPVDSMGRNTGEAFVQFRNKQIAEKALLKHKEKIGHRYIEIFRSNLSEVFPESTRRGGPMNYPPSRPAPYDSRDRFGGPNRFRGGNGGGGGGPMGPMGGPMGPRGGGFRGGFMNEMDDDWWPNRGRGPMGPGPDGPRGGGFNNYGPGGGFGGGYNGGGPPGPPGPHIINMRGLPFRATKQDIADFFAPVIPLSIDISSADKGRAEVEFRSYNDALMAMTKDKSNMSHRYIELFMNEPHGIGPKKSYGGKSNGGSYMPGSRFKRH